ncbi:MAG: carboxypeptidase regulatory-like domain-containing protein [Candidatus Hodarchaeales archaeon]
MKRNIIMINLFLLLVITTMALTTVAFVPITRSGAVKPVTIDNKLIDTLTCDNTFKSASREGKNLQIENSEVNTQASPEQASTITATSSILVHVSDEETAKPVYSATVAVVTAKGTLVFNGLTDVNGHVTAGGLYTGQYNVTVIKTGYQNQTKTVSIAINGFNIDVYFSMSKKTPDSGFLEVMVRDKETLTVITGAEVKLSETFYIFGQPIHYFPAVYTNASGWANVTGIPTGSFKVHVSAAGYVTYYDHVTIAYDGDGDRIYAYLHPLGVDDGFIEVTACDLEGNVLNGANVYIYNSSKDLVDSGTTDISGFYNITGLDIGVYEVTVAHDGYYKEVQETKIDYSTDGDYLVFVLHEKSGTGVLTIAIGDWSSSPLEGAVIDLYDYNDTLVCSLITGEDGQASYSNGLPSGWYTAAANATGYLPANKSVFIEEGITTTLKFFLIPLDFANGSIDIRITSSSGENISDAYIMVINVRGEICFSGLTGSDGSLSIDGLLVGDYTVSVQKSGYEEQEKHCCINYNGDTDHLLFILSASPEVGEGCIEITVTDPNGILLSSAYVHITNQKATRTGYTDKFGFINVTNLYTGDYTITVSLKGYNDVTVKTRLGWVGDKDIIAVTLHPETTGSINVYITGLKAKSDVWVKYQKYEGTASVSAASVSTEWSTWSKWVKADETGHARLINIAPGIYRTCSFYNGIEHFSTVTISCEGQEEVTVHDIAPAEPDGVRTNWALVVAGSSEYQIARDVNDMYKTLVNNFSFSEDHVYYITHYNSENRDRETSLDNILWGISQIAYRCDADDEIVVWWTGHGGVDSLNTFTGWTPISVIADALAEINCANMYIFFDSCHSGSFIDDLAEPNRAIFTCCAANEVGWMDPFHCVFSLSNLLALDPFYPTYDFHDILAYNADILPPFGEISLFEMFHFAYDFSTTYTSQGRYRTTQHPQKWLGESILNDLVHTVGDGYYLGRLAAEENPGKISINGKSSRDSSITAVSTEDVGIKATAGNFDFEQDWDDFIFQAINNSYERELLSGVEISVYCKDGTMIASGITNSSGLVQFYDFLEGKYEWEAVIDGLEVASGNIEASGKKMTITVFPENWDQQGDGCDFRFQATDLNSFYVSNVTIMLFTLEGNWVGNCTTDYIGDGFIFDADGDGIYGYEAIIAGEVVDEGLVTVDSNSFELKTDDVDPEVTIISPVNGGTIEINSLPVQLIYNITDDSDYIINIYINGTLIGYMANGSLLSGLNSTGTFIIRVEAEDVAGNTGQGEITVTVVDTGTSTTTTGTYTITTTTTTGTETTTTSGTGTTTTSAVNVTTTAQPVPSLTVIICMATLLAVSFRRRRGG